MLNRLQARHREIARLTFDGMKATDIAEKVGVSVHNIYQLQKEPLFKQAVSRLYDDSDKKSIDVKKRLAELAISAVEVLDTTLQSKNEGLSFKAAQDILNRSGYSEKLISEHRHVHAHLTPDDISNLKERAVAAGAVVSNDESN